MRYKAMYVRVCLENNAQATVEAAVVFPVLLVLALIVVNVMTFAAAVARFDRVVPDIVLAHGVSPKTEGDALIHPSHVAGIIQEEIEYAMGGYPVTVEVTFKNDTEHAASVFSFSRGLVTYTCTLRYATWPGPLSIARVSLGAPLELDHMRSVTIDPWHPGVVI